MGPLLCVGVPLGEGAFFFFHELLNSGPNLNAQHSRVISFASLWLFIRQALITPHKKRAEKGGQAKRGSKMIKLSISIPSSLMSM